MSSESCNARVLAIDFNFHLLSHGVRFFIDGRHAKDRRDAERALQVHLEKIDEEPNFLPASYLRSGADRAQAVGRRQHGASAGVDMSVCTPSAIGTAPRFTAILQRDMDAIDVETVSRRTCK